MGLLFLLAAAAVLLLGACSGSSSHSLRFFFTGVSEPGEGLPWFILVGYVDNRLFVQYDSNSRRYRPRVSWIEKLVEEEDPHYWDWNTRNAQGWEPVFRGVLETLRGVYNQSHGGVHTWQRMQGCELSQDGTHSGCVQYAYDGRDFLTLDVETLSWTAVDVPAQVTKSKWERETNEAQLWKAYLEGRCIDYLQKHLKYGNETLLRTETPIVHVERKAEDDGLETFVFRFHGFYPKEMDVTWVKDGEVWTQDTFRGRVAPNSDGTYYTWHSITIHPKERDRYRCHVEHDGLEEPLDLALEESGGSVSMWNITGPILGIVAAAVLVTVGIILYKKRRERAAYRAASASDRDRVAPTELACEKGAVEDLL